MSFLGLLCHCSRFNFSVSSNSLPQGDVPFRVTTLHQHKKSSVVFTVLHCFPKGGNNIRKVLKDLTRAGLKRSFTSLILSKLENPFNCNTPICLHHCEPKFY